MENLEEVKKVVSVPSEGIAQKIFIDLQAARIKVKADKIICAQGRDCVMDDMEDLTATLRADIAGVCAEHLHNHGFGAETSMTEAQIKQELLDYWEEVATERAPEEPEE